MDLGASAGSLGPLAYAPCDVNALVYNTNSFSTEGQVWSSLPKHTAPNCPLDYVLVNLVRVRRACEGAGGNVQEFQKRKFPSVQSLLNPKREAERSPVTSAIVNNIIHIMTVPTLPEQIAILYVMSSLVRWQISPTEANYDSLPDWLRPTASQLFCPHPAWIDVFPWPKARERIARYTEYHDQNANFSKLCNASITINWPHHHADMLVQVSSTESILNPIFERHIRNLKNWALGQQFIDA